MDEGHQRNKAQQQQQRALAVEGLPSKRIEEELMPKPPSVMQKMSEGKLVEEGFDVLR